MALSHSALINASQLTGSEGLYFIGLYTPRITFYSQQVRALELAHALDALKLIKPDERTAVVGAGAAGVTMAVALALLGKEVVLYDPAQSILQLQSASSRLLHPHIYEWPRLGSLDDRAGLPVMDWTAGNGGAVCTALRAEFSKIKAALPELTFEPGHLLNTVTRSGGTWLLNFTKAEKPQERAFAHVVLAIGFGEERPCGDVYPEDYWRPRSIGTPATEPIAGTRYIVSGNGDGALTEALGLLISDFEHVAFTRNFLSFFSGDELRIAATAVFASRSFGEDVEPHLRTQLLPKLTINGVIDRLKPLLRNDRSVTINSAGPLFSAGRASQLNHCMVFAVIEAAGAASIEVKRTTGFVTNASTSEAGTLLTGITFGGNPITDRYRHAILRHGPDADKRYRPIEALLPYYKAHFTAQLSANAALADPPHLDNSTFERFETLRIERTADHASKASQLQLAAAAQHSIEVSIDPAARVVVERGTVRIVDVARDGERLQSRVTIDLYVTPACFIEGVDLGRVALSSQGKIELRAGTDVRGDWERLLPGIALAPEPTSVRASHELTTASLSGCVDACLVRALTKCLSDAVALGASAPLGPISPPILAEVATTWTDWSAKLEADATLRFDFLRWLANVSQDVPSPWDGNRASVQRLANALIMMAAAHIEEPLEPTSMDCGNLTFANGSQALGSGCESIGMQPISVRDEPDHWGVDALILSASSEVVVHDPPGRVLDGGMIGTTLLAARRVRPVIIQNNKLWRDRFAGALCDWRSAIAVEFAEWRKRQDIELNGVSG